MASLRHDRFIKAPATVVWDVIADPAAIVEWFPGIVWCQVEGRQRTIRTAAGLEFPEEILAIDSSTRHFAYRIVAPSFHFHLGTIDVVALDEGSSLCLYATTALPDAMALMIAGATIGALEQIAQRSEALALA